MHTHKVWYPYPVWCFVSYLTNDWEKQKERGSEREDVRANYHQSTSKWFWQAPLVWTHKQMQTDKQIRMHVHAHTHTHTNVTMWSRVFCGRQLFTVCWVDCLIVSHWTGIRPYPKCHSAPTWPTWHYVSNTGICIWTLAQLWREKQKRGHLWQITSWLLLWLSLCVPNCISFFPPPCRYLQFLILFFFFYSHTICLLRSLSSSRFVHVHFCALLPPYLWGFWSLTPPAKSHLPGNLTAIDPTTEMSFLRSPRNSRGFDCPHKRLHCTMMLS